MCVSGFKMLKKLLKIKVAKRAHPQLTEAKWTRILFGWREWSGSWEQTIVSVSSFMGIN